MERTGEIDTGGPRGVCRWTGKVTGQRAVEDTRSRGYTLWIMVCWGDQDECGERER